MKATKESRSDKLKNAIDSVAGSSSENSKKKTSGSKSVASNGSKRGRGRPKGSKNKKSQAGGVGLGALAGEIIAKGIEKAVDDKSKEGQGSSKNKNSTKKSSSSTKSSTKKSNSSNSTKPSVNSTTTRIVKSTEKSYKKPRKKKNLTMFLVVIFLIIGVVGGFFGAKYILRDDVYEMVKYENGECDVVISGSEEEGLPTKYVERGVKCVAFGKDYSSKYTVKYYYRNDLSNDEVEVESVDTGVAGMYYAVYEVPTLKYKTVKLIRNITVLRGEDNG